MSNPSPHKTNDGNRLSLINAAADAFAESGFEGASLRSIAEAAGVSYQLISHYFGNKEDLWRATVDHLTKRYSETGNGLAFDVSGNVRLQFRNHLRLLLTDLLQRPQLRKIWAQEHFASSERFTRAIEPELKSFFDELVLPYYREVLRLGIVQRFTPEEMSIIIGAILQLNIVYPYPLELALGADTGSAKSVNRQVDLLFDMLTLGDDDAGLKAQADVAPGTAGPTAPAETDGDQALTNEAEGNAELARLRSENTDLKKVLAELLVQKAALHGKLRAPG